MKKKLLLLSLFLTFVVSAQEQYYSDVDITAEGLALKENLASKTISAHTNILSYGWDALKITDVNPENSSEVLLIYGYSSGSGTTSRTRGINDHGGDSGDWNREHVYAKSLGTPNLGDSGPGADGHHLRPSDVTFNGQRGSKKFANGSGNAGDQNSGWYPGDEWKGDVARIMMYMYIRYGNQCKPTGVGNGSSASTPDDMIDLFLEWNVEDPVSDFERQRNTYHVSNGAYAQGNRNPFIDNAYLATRIWGGTPAEDSWGIYTSNDNEAPTVPANIALSAITTSTITASWTASEDNEAVTKYEVYANETLNGETANTNYTLTGLTPNTAYSITVLAKDIANNKSAQSTAVNGTTLADTTAPSIPTGVTISNETGTSFKITWTASTDDSGVASYEVFVDGNSNGTSANTDYQVTGLTASTTYSITVLATDVANNSSVQSAGVNATTTDGSNNIVELLFSEYVEGSGNNKALEIVNITENPINLSGYSIKKQSNGAGGWIDELQLTGTIAVNDVFVMIHYQADKQTLLTEADLVGPSSNNGAPVNFNGNDPVGLFKNGVLIDVIGILDNATKTLDDTTLRRKKAVTKGNTTYTASEWDVFPVGTYDDIGKYYETTASVNDNVLNSITMYPNPTNGNILFIKATENTKVTIYNLLGKVVHSASITANKNDIDVSKLNNGIYVVKITADGKSSTKKLIKN